MELFVVQGPDAGRNFPLGPQSVLGRDPTAAISLLDAEVSRRHAIVSVDEGRVQVEDLGSSNGTFIEGERIKKETELMPSWRLQVGQTILELRRSEGGDDPEHLPPTKVSLPELGEDPPDSY